MSRIFSITLIAFVALVFAPVSNAQGTASTNQTNQTETLQQISAEKRALIMELLEVMNAGKSSEQVFNVMFDEMQSQRKAMIWESLKDTKILTAKEQLDLREEIERTAERTTKLFKERFIERVNFPKMINEISLELYGKYYTDDELRDLVNFYKSPTGRKTMEILPALLAESMNKTSERLMPIVKDLVSEIAKGETPSFQKQVDELIKSHHRTPGRRKNKGQ